MSELLSLNNKIIDISIQDKISDLMKTPSNLLRIFPFMFLKDNEGVLN